ncbi:AfsR/SARP family transcriptional regulator [Streptomyces violascens]|uniref:AfsR/SARP family transcriptional regulator n=1 Tax=Streptomyces violascens TaxID=67381 RepID=UPI0036470CC5
MEFWVDGNQIDLGPARQRNMLAALLADPGNPVSIKTLIDRVWGDMPPDAVRSVVYTYIARLRRTLSKACAGMEKPIEVTRSAAGYRVDVDPEDVDLSAFRALLAKARAASADDPRRRGWLQEALGLWRGEALAGLNSDWAIRFRGNLHELRHEALAERTDAELFAGCGGVVIDELRQALLEAPLAEVLHERLVQALYATGRNAEALRQYECARQHIADELGAYPGARLKELHRLILQSESALESGADARRVELSCRGIMRVPTVVQEASASRASEPDLLPMNPGDFSGRDTERAWMFEALSLDASRTSPAVVLVGGPGVGKTALALHVAHRLRDTYSDGRLYANLRGSGDQPADPGVVLGRLLRALGVGSSEIPGDLDERAEVFRNRLSGRRVLLLLDDAADEKQVRPLLPGSPECAVVVTSRTFLGGAPGGQVRVLGELPQEQAVEALARMVGNERVLAERDAAHQLVDLCGGLPIALRAVANRLVSRPHWTLNKLLVRMGDEGRRLDELARGTCAIKTGLDRSYSRLDPTAARLFQYLGATAAREVTASSVLGLAEIEVEDALEQLADLHLLHISGRDSRGRTRYRLNGLNRIYARNVTVAKLSMTA